MLMKSDRSVKDHVQYLHDKVKKLLALNLSETEIIEALKEDEADEFYTKTIIDNILADKDDNKGFWKLLIFGILAIMVSTFIYFAPDFDRFRSGWIYLFLFWAPIIGGITLITRAFVIFRK